ncbi:hypothetical protein ACFYXD_23125 [Streptomyces platensis]|uniref:hypothetical protein n=1 Tax=Streptomyces platensis TaxID=58346 RepID=UPI0036C823B1
MTTSGAEVKIGAIQAAWDQVSILRTGDNQKAWPEPSQRIAAAAALYSRGELHRGTVILIDGALHQVGAGEDGQQQTAGTGRRRPEGQQLVVRMLSTGPARGVKLKLKPTREC